VKIYLDKQMQVPSRTGNLEQTVLVQTGNTGFVCVFVGPPGQMQSICLTEAGAEQVVEALQKFLVDQKLNRAGEI
jgi:hypothetical protein